MAIVDYLSSSTDKTWSLNKSMSDSTIVTLLKRGYLFRDSATKNSIILSSSGTYWIIDPSQISTPVPISTTNSGTTNTTNVSNPIYADCDALAWSGKLAEAIQCKADNWSLWNQYNVDVPINKTITNTQTFIDDGVQWVDGGVKELQDKIDAGLIKTQADFDKFVADSKLNLDSLGAGFEAFKLQAQQNLDNALSFGDDIKKYGLIAGVGIGVLVLILVLKK